MRLVTIEMIELSDCGLKLHFENDSRVFTLKNNFMFDDSNRIVIYDNKCESTLQTGKSQYIIDWQEEFSNVCRILLQQV